jgi:VIT1/CCC1 family predicted Fe2+/Mn2+ transporter
VGAARTEQRWRDEKASAWLYGEVARIEPDPVKAKLFLALAGAAETQAAVLAGDIVQAGGAMPVFSPPLRARVVAAVTRRVGLPRARPFLAAMKVRGLSVYDPPLAVGHAMPISASQVGLRHKRGGSTGTLRAAVFGVNDGLVSNTSLILGVAGASAEPGVVLLSGVAGLLAGAFSMAAGEYISMRSQRELFESQIGEEREELARYPEEEAEELALIYAARGIPEPDARRITRALLQHPEQALDTLAREELGLNPGDLGSPAGAALSSFLAFGAGALLPLIPFLLGARSLGVPIAAGLSAVGLFGVGVALSLFSGRSALLGGFRMLGIGGAAGGVTYAIGTLLGVSLS